MRVTFRFFDNLDLIQAEPKETRPRIRIKSIRTTPGLISLKNALLQFPLTEHFSLMILLLACRSDCGAWRSMEPSFHRWDIPSLCGQFCFYYELCPRIISLIKRFY
jgi:hypothetical protein